MKKITIILATMLTVSTAFAFTGKEAANSRALNSFKSEFIHATNATWTNGKDFDKVSFIMNGQQLEAFYNKSGEFLAMTQNISSVELSASLKKSLKKSMGNGWITELFEITNLEETSWYATVETADSKIVLRSHNGGSWTVFQRSEK